MSEARSHKVIVALVVASSLCATALITMLVMKRAQPTPAGSVGHSAPGGASGSAPIHITPITPTADPAPTTAPSPVSATLPPALYPAPAFSFTQRDGSVVTSKDLVGKIVIADFIFTRCGTICPRMSEQMAILQTKLKDKPYWNQVRLVSFTVDPDFDTPEVLTDYAKRFDADKTHWLFLTGKRREMWSIITGGFKLPVAENTENSLMPILHSEKFVLIDADGKIRSYYDGLLAEPFDRLLADIAQLAATTR